MISHLKRDGLKYPTLGPILSKMAKLLLMILVCLGIGPSVSAEVPFKAYRKVAVFPIAVPQLEVNSEDAWWQAREILVQDQKFLVASRRLMMNRGVFQPRKDLKPADSIILAKILDAEIVISIYVEDRKIFFRAYEGESGFRLWISELEMHPAVPIQDQLVSLTQKLTGDFLTAFPYHGWAVPGETDGPMIFQKGSEKYSFVYTGQTANVDVGDPVQWVEVFGDPSFPLLQSPRVLIVAEGEVSGKMGDKVEVKVSRLNSLEALREGALVRLPKELTRQRESRGLGGDRISNLSHEYLSSELKDARSIDKKQSSTSTALAFIAGLAAMILLAF